MDPTLNEIREELAEEREMATEKARIELKVALLKQLASASDALDKEIEALKERRDALKGARKNVKTLADVDDLTAEDIVSVLTTIGDAHVVARLVEPRNEFFFHNGGSIRSDMGLATEFMALKGRG